MNQVTNEQKNQVMKTMAIVGFVAVIIFGVWLAVRLVSLMPSAFSSLASIADVVYNYEEIPKILSVTSEDKTINSGNLSNISWNKVSANGVFTFSYVCTDGVSIDVRTTAGMTTTACGENITLGSTQTDTDIIVESEKQHFTDINYTISFIKEGDTKPTLSENGSISVLNPNIPDKNVAVINNTELIEPAENTTDIKEEVTVKPTPTVIPPTTIETIVYETPLSNPDGFVDLAIKLFAVGYIDSFGNFIKGNSIDNDTKGAYKFEVKNIGTKTSNDWHFNATLTSGTKYTSPTQKPLKPKERVVFTLGYDNVGTKGIQTIGATVKGGNDINTKNNRFTWAVSVLE